MADVYVNALTTISTEPTTTDSLVAVNRNTNEGQIIDYNLLADKILAKLSSKTFSSLTTSSKLLPGAINELDADITTLSDRLMPISVTVLANSSTTITEYTPSSSDRRLIIFSHSTATALRGIYIVLSPSVVSPLIEATGLTVSMSGGNVVVTNNTGSSANGVVFT